MLPPVSCAVAGRCAACSWIEIPHDVQLRRKRDAVHAAWTAQGLDTSILGNFPITVVTGAETRDRVDLQFRRDASGLRLGFATDGEIVDIDRCPQATPALDRWICEFKTLVPPVTRGGARLRVAPDGTRGVWLDLSNVDVKALFEEKTALQRLAAMATLEIGQRRKRVTFTAEGAPKFREPEVFPWFETPAGEQTAPIFSVVGGFTQPGFAVNRALVAALLRAIPEKTGRWIELGAGVGNFTVPLAAQGLTLVAVENDPLALQGLARTLEYPLPEKPEIYDESFDAPTDDWVELVSLADGVVADPPRSGLGKFCEVLAEAAPKTFIYVSCFPESFARDAAKLLAQGYQLKTLEGVDQFPQTPHLELVARFECV